MLNSKIQLLQNHFGIAKTEDWQDVTPQMILSQDGIGKATLDYVRICLAMRELSLKDDATPEYWRKHLKTTKIGEVMGNELIDPEDGGAADRGIVCPFTILIDSAEQEPYSFQGLQTDSKDGHRPINIPVEFQCLGRHPDSFGDYTIKGFKQRVCIERKSMEDAHGTFLGWKDGRRERFEKELENLNSAYRSYVIVEANFDDLINNAPEWGKKTAQENKKILYRTILAWQHRFHCVQWQFLNGRRLAEVTCFRIFERFFNDEVIDVKFSKPAKPLLLDEEPDHDNEPDQPLLFNADTEASNANEWAEVV